MQMKANISDAYRRHDISDEFWGKIKERLAFRSESLLQQVPQRIEQLRKC
jgi:hypothetical protein